MIIPDGIVGAVIIVVMVMLLVDCYELKQELRIEKEHHNITRDLYHTYFNKWNDVQYELQSLKNDEKK